FIGTIRDQTDGLDVVGLDYEAYRPMAETVLQKIAGEHARAHALTSLAIRHRVGSLAVGEVALAVVVAAPHREAAFAACRNVVEAIKADVPIWKREHFRSGARWVGSSEMEPREVG
ncbi:MAG TPA: molybdenum cofactor biosynthesis protein MoaE, partial [Candidatus Sulfotelmatobacter sp.]|nr:molybdenum cofactor biosynthesis protein MoaE [Candidatus Sulfotelmatobacter sp.]